MKEGMKITAESFVRNESSVQRGCFSCIILGKASVARKPTKKTDQTDL
jgi:hypothetical protein